MTDPIDPGLRGNLEIRSRAVHSVATAAARATAGVTETQSSLAGLAGRGLPRAEVTVAGITARARVTVAVAWPTPIAPVAAAVRAAVAADLHNLCGYATDRVDVEVRCIAPANSGAGRVQ